MKKKHLETTLSEEVLKRLNSLPTKEESFASSESSQRKLRKKYIPQANCFEFPKSERFKQQKLSYDQRKMEILYLPDAKSGKAVSFGLGRRNLFSSAHIRKARENPSPFQYGENRTFHNKTKTLHFAKTFGISYAYYENTLIPNSHLTTQNQQKLIPGVGEYFVGQDLEIRNKNFKMAEKGKSNVGIGKAIAPPCNQYNPRYSIAEIRRFHSTTLGKGIKFDFTKNPNPAYFPGPGQYSLETSFEQILRKNNPERNQSNDSHEYTKFNKLGIY